MSDSNDGLNIGTFAVARPCDDSYIINGQVVIYIKYSVTYSEGPFRETWTESSDPENGITAFYDISKDFGYRHLGEYQSLFIPRFDRFRDSDELSDAPASDVYNRYDGYDYYETLVTEVYAEKPDDFFIGFPEDGTREKNYWSIELVSVEQWERIVDAAQYVFFCNDRVDPNGSVASSGNDVLVGTSSADELRGLKGDDTLRGFGGKDTLFGGAGNDKLLGGGGNDKLLGGSGRDTLKAAGGKDKLFGGSSKDKLFAGSGDDVLKGDGGNDKLHGEKGNDKLTGGGGSDVFVFKGKFGRDIITDFNARSGKEDINLSGVKQIKSFADLARNHMSERSDDVLIKAGKSSIRLEDVELSDLGANDFIF